MRLSLALIGLALAAAFPFGIARADAPAVDARKPAAMIVDGAPIVPDSLVAATRPYMEARAAAFVGWNADHSMAITTRFGNTFQLHRVAGPMMDRRQMTFEAEPVQASVSPSGALTVLAKDNGGDEFYQLYRLEAGRPILLTDGKSRNIGPVWSADSQWMGYTSTRRNGADTDLYVMDPRDPKTDRMVAQVSGGGWGFMSFSRDDRHAVVANGISATHTDLYDLDLATGKMTAIGDTAKDINYGGGIFAPDGRFWVTSDEGSDFVRLGILDLKTGKFTPKSPNPKWDVDGFDISADGSFVAYTINEAGSTGVKVLDTKTGALRSVTSLPPGSGWGLKIAPWGTIGLTFDSAKASADAYSIDPKTLKATRWTQSETGGLDPNVNVDPVLVQIKSFDGELISGFLYRPDPKKFPGKRPLIINIHGGPEAQSYADFMGRDNYLLNALGVAIFLPNVRGSTGFGKRFVSLDDGPFKREDSVKDIGAFLDAFVKDPTLDPARIAVTGASYGGYMCYASAIRYGARLKGAWCDVAISNFVTFLENTQSYRRDLRRVEYGDERDPVQRAKMIDISPITHVDQFNIPLLVASGANDPRVPSEEADQIVKAIRAKGGTAWSLLAKDEGHGYQKKENSDYEYWVGLMFWQQTLLK